MSLVTGVLRCTGEDYVTTGECPAQREKPCGRKENEVGLTWLDT